MIYLQNLIDFFNNILWGYILIVSLIGLGLYFSISTKFLQFRYLKEMIRLLGNSATKEVKDFEEHTEEKSISSFQAFCMSAASRIGTGNLAGVSIAISIGGPGAVFWMWVIALIGAASGLVESTLAQLYKKDDNDGFVGGPAYYMEKGLNKKWMGAFFSILITLSFGFVFNSVQSNTITIAFESAFGLNRLILGLIITIIVAIIIFGGAKRIAHVSEIMVPVMAIIYLGVASFIVIKNIAMFPEVIKMIIGGAFGIKQIFGGGLGIALMQGIKRGLFSNEAGMGSSPNAGAAAKVSHPVKQGFIQALGVYVDTILICTATAFVVIISSNSWLGVENVQGIAITQLSIASQVGNWGNHFVAISVLLFAFSSIIGNYYYGEINISFLNKNKFILNLYRIIVLFMVLFGSISKVQIVWDLADVFMGLMAITNLIAIGLLGKLAFALLKDYEIKHKKGLDPEFKIKDLSKEIRNKYNLYDLSKEWD